VPAVPFLHPEGIARLGATVWSGEPRPDDGPGFRQPSAFLHDGNAVR